MSARALANPAQPPRNGFLHKPIRLLHARTRGPAAATPSRPQPSNLLRLLRNHAPPVRPPSLRSGSRPGAVPVPPSGSLPEDRYHPVNANLDLAIHP